MAPTWGKFNKTFTRVIYKCSYCSQTLKLRSLRSMAVLVGFAATPLLRPARQNRHATQATKTMATLVNYTCRSFIKLTPGRTTTEQTYTISGLCGMLVCFLAQKILPQAFERHIQTGFSL